MTVTTRFKVGDHVRISDDRLFPPWDTGTVIGVIDGDDDHETRYQVQEAPGRSDERDVETIDSSQLEADDSGFLDTDSVIELRAELIASVNGESKYVGLAAEVGHDRIIAASRIAYLASRLAWLETCELRAMQRAGEPPLIEQMLNR